MITEEFNSEVGFYECFDSRNPKLVVFTGYGETKESANTDYHLKMSKIFKPDPRAIVVNYVVV